MAKKNNQSVKQVIRAAGPVISRSEMNQIVNAAGGNVQTAVNRIASVQQNMRESGGAAPSVASGAANMLIKQAAAAPMYAPVSFGGSRLGQTLQSMVGSPATPNFTNPISGYQPGNAGVPPSLIPGGMMIRPGGNLAVRPQTTMAQPSSGGLTYNGQPIQDGVTYQLNDAGTAIVGIVAPGTPGTPEYYAATGKGGLSPNDVPAGGGTLGGEAAAPNMDASSVINDLMGSAGDYSSQFEDLQNQISTMFSELSSQIDTMNPLQLAALGRAYGGDLMRARARQGKRRGDYLRNRMNNMATGNRAAAPLAIGGGVNL